MSFFKNVIVYRIEPSWSQELSEAEQSLDSLRFAPCSPSQEKSIGWVPPRDENGPLIESVGGQWVLEFMIESKTLPASVIKRKVAERVAQIEATTGRKPGKKEQKELKEDITHELMPMAFTRHARITVWIDRTHRRLVVNASNAARADEIVSSLVQAFSGFAVGLIHTRVEPAAAMSGWLHSQEPPAEFTIDRECELKATDESKSVVRYAKHALDIDEVRQHIEQGKRPTRLAMTWDDRVSFELTEGMQIRKIVFLESTDDAATGKKEDNFDADVAIATGELGHLVPALIDALGGEQELVAAADEKPAVSAKATSEPIAGDAAELEEEAPF